jgi:hypothetical protein
MKPQLTKEWILKELPALMKTDPAFREAVLEIGRYQFADKAETESHFDRMLARLDKKMDEDRRKWEENRQEHLAMTSALAELTQQFKQEREENHRKWEGNDHKWEENDHRWEENQRQWLENQRKWEENDHRWEENQRQWLENQRKWEENDRQWEENRRKWEENDRQWLDNHRRWENNDRQWEENRQEHREMRKDIKRLDQTVGAVGARWGVHTEATFRNAIAGLLKEFAAVEVIHVDEHDDEGVVFGYPEEVELDLIIQDGILIIGEIKSSIDKGGVYLFEKKVRFYENKHGQTANRKLIISPMVDKKAWPAAKNLGIEVYSYADEVVF